MLAGPKESQGSPRQVQTEALPEFHGAGESDDVGGLVGVTERAIPAAVWDGRLDAPAADGTWSRVEALRQLRENARSHGKQRGPKPGSRGTAAREGASQQIIRVPSDGHGLTDDVTPEAVARAEAQLRRVMATHGEGLVRPMVHQTRAPDSGTPDWRPEARAPASIESGARCGG